MSRLGGGCPPGCDGAITTNHFLAARIEDFAQMPTWVVANFLNGLQLELLNEVRQAPRIGEVGAAGHQHRLLQRDADAIPATSH